MSYPIFESVLASYIKGLVAEKNALGSPYESQIVHLKYFDRLIKKNYPAELTITKTMLDEWSCRKAYEKYATVRHRTTPVRDLALYMNRLGVKAYVFPVNSFPKEERYISHIYTDDELKRFFYEVDHCHYSCEVPFRHLVMPVLFRMIYCCGLRPNEALSLRIKDIDFEQGIVTILHSKNDSDRQVAMAIELNQLCLDLQNKIHTFSSSENYFFPGYKGGKITSDNINHNFRRFLYQADIPHGGKGKGPRIYDFRHTFAVNCLRKLVLEGKNMNAYYPVLKTYMGHSLFKYTAYYLKLTQNMFPNICNKLSIDFGDVIPVLEKCGDSDE